MADVIFTGDASNLEAAAEKAQAAINGVAAATEKMEGKTGKATKKTMDLGQASTKLRGILSTVSPALGNVAGGANDAADAFEVLGTKGGAAGAVLATALGLVAVAYANYAQDLAQTAAIAETSRAADEKRLGTYGDTQTALIDMKVASGELTAAQGDLNKAYITGAQKLEEMNLAAMKQIVANEKLKQSWTTQVADAIQPLIANMGFFTDAFDLATTTSDEIDAVTQGLTWDIAENTAAVTDNTAAEADAIKAKEKAEKAEKAKAAAVKATTEAVAMAMAQQAQAQADEDRWGDYLASKRKKWADDQLALADKNEKEIAQGAKELSDKLSADTDAAAEHEKQALADNREINQQYYDSVAGMAQKSLDLVSELADEELRKRQAINDRLTQVLADGEDTLTKRQKKALEEKIAANKEAALQAFEVSQAVAVAQAAISTAMAVVNALATPVPFPVAVGFAVAAGLAGAAEEVAILSQSPPTFEDTPGIMRGIGSSERTQVSLARDDYFVASKTRAGLAAQVAPPGRPQITTFRIGRREVREIQRTDIRTGGLMTQTARREARYNSSGVGRSGKQVLA